VADWVVTTYQRALQALAAQAFLREGPPGRESWREIPELIRPRAGGVAPSPPAAAPPVFVPPGATPVPTTPTGPSVVDQLPPSDAPPWYVQVGVGGAVAGATPAIAAWLWSQARGRLRKVKGKKLKRQAKRAARSIVEYVKEEALRRTPKGRAATRAVERIFGAGARPSVGVIARTAGRVLARFPAAGIFVPSEIAKERPVTPEEVRERFLPRAGAQTKGPGTRIRPVAPGQGPARPVKVSVIPPGRRPTVAASYPAAPAPARPGAPGVTTPSSSRTTTPSSSRTTTPSSTSRLVTSAMLLGAALLPLTLTQDRRRARRDPLSVPAPFGSPVTQSGGALTPTYPAGVGSRTCECPPRRRSGKRRCTNPITSKTKRTRGGVEFQTITRRLQCPV
jgi:hypothetical protein